MASLKIPFFGELKSRLFSLHLETPKYDAMKRLNSAIFVLTVAWLLTSCDGKGVSFSSGVKKDFSTGASTRYEGFDLEDVSLVDGNNEVMNSSEIPLNSTFSIVYNGITGYTVENEKVFPGLSLQVTDSAGQAVLNEADLFANYTEGVSAQDASVLTGTVTVGDPMKAGKNYHCTMRIFDKKGKAEIVTELDFTVK